jgi:hypothetical protein
MASLESVPKEGAKVREVSIFNGFLVLVGRHRERYHHLLDGTFGRYALEIPSNVLAVARVSAEHVCSLEVATRRRGQVVSERHGAVSSAYASMPQADRT